MLNYRLSCEKLTLMSLGQRTKNCYPRDDGTFVADIDLKLELASEHGTCTKCDLPFRPEEVRCVCVACPFKSVSVLHLRCTARRLGASTNVQAKSSHSSQQLAGALGLCADCNEDSENVGVCRVCDTVFLPSAQGLHAHKSPASPENDDQQ